MLRRHHLLLPLICALLPIWLSGCGLGQRFHDWMAKPVERRGLPEKKAPVSGTEPPPPAEDFSDYQPRPIPSGPDTPVMRDLEPVRLRWLRSMSIDLYHDMGIRDPRWDDEAEALLEAYALVESCHSDRPGLKEYERLADALVATDCADPLARMAAGTAFFRARRYEEARANVYYYGPSGKEPDYPNMAIWRGCVTGAQVYCMLNPADHEFVSGTSGAVTSILDAGLTRARFRGEEARAAYLWTHHALCTTNRERPQSLVNRLRDTLEVDRRGTEGPDRWLLNTMLGHLETGIAASVRDGVFDEELAAFEWKSYDTRVEAARRHLMIAHRLHPAWPEAAALMIDVIRGEGGETIAGRAWFDRAVAAQLDHVRAYAAYIRLLKPRWGGSHQQMWEFARECMATERYDTLVPFVGHVIAREIALDEDRPEFLTDEMYDELCTMYDGYLIAPDPNRDERHIRTVRAGLASLTGRHLDAVHQLDLLGAEVDEDLLIDTFKRSPFRIKREAAIATSPIATKLAEAEAARRSGDYAEAKRICEKALTASTDSVVAEIASGRLRAMEIEEALKSGETVDLLPGFTLWQCPEVMGHWEIDESGALVNGFTGEWAEVLFPVELRDGYRMSVELRFPATDDRVSAGIVFAQGFPNAGSHGSNAVLLAHRYSHLLRVDGDRLSPMMNRRTHVNRRCELTAEVYNQTFAGYMDHRKVFGGYVLMEWAEQPERELVGVLIRYLGDVAEPVRIERVTVEPVAEEPPGWVDPEIRLPRLERPWAGKLPEGYAEATESLGPP